MKQKQFDRLVQLVIALVVLVGLGWLVARGDIAGESALTFVGIILAAFGFEAGRRVQYRRE
ncbi:hypothetical protein [Halococcus hamelinensis]|uniref:Uncharacterized protein n=1 Tax=Halococcus hamelinensis 100A6 TaxID=1132509 RepID=M0M1J0_9EURY|nr:hypothetical protein [Halococcus hamelinensis]EMA38459.1 hypothetical protein C447_09902 [Halococcus hamelinensis 100A6]